MDRVVFVDVLSYGRLLRLLIHGGATFMCFLVERAIRSLVVLKSDTGFGLPQDGRAMPLLKRL